MAGGAWKRIGRQNGSDIGKMAVKVCSQCQETKALVDFYARRASPDGLGYICKTCSAANGRLRYSLKSDEVKAKAKAWSHANAERRREIVRASQTKHADKKNAHQRVLNKERYYRDIDASRQRSREDNKAFRGRNPDRAHEMVKLTRQRAKERDPVGFALKALERVNRRRAQKKATETEPVDYASILERDGMICHICEGAIHTRTELHFDHVIPLSKGGPHHASNIKPSHAICNMKKGSRV